MIYDLIAHYADGRKYAILMGVTGATILDYLRQDDLEEVGDMGQPERYEIVNVSALDTGIAAGGALG